METVTVKKKGGRNTDTLTFKKNAPRLVKARAEAARLKSEADALLRGVESTQTVLCSICGKRSQVQNIDYADWYWYESPHGCMGGDHWHRAGFFYNCPKCGHTMKEYPPQSYESDEKKAQYEALAHLIRTYGKAHNEVHLQNWYAWINETK